MGRNKTTWSSAETRLIPKEFYQRGVNQEIAILDLGGVEAPNDSKEHLSQVEELEREEGTKA